MNWCDLLVIAIIVGFGIIGMVNGFIFSMFRLVSFFLSAVIAIKFYPVVANILMKTSLFTSIKASIYKNLLLQQEAQSPGVDAGVKKAAAETVINNLHLPKFLKGTLVEHMPNPTKLIDMKSLMDTLSGELAKVVISVISLVLLYILIRIGMIFLRFILQGVAKLPVFKQVNKLGGFAFGAVEGLLTIYILFAVILLFRTSPSFKSIFDAIDKSVIAAYFYQHNFIIEMMFGSK